jgi:NADH pyrophosphatase NudC (nudix superfamily)
MQNTHPLKILKYCPKCSSPKFEISGERSLKCADCGFHFYINASAAVAALVTDGYGKLMLVTRGVEPDFGKLDLPGGFVDPGETVENAVIRELEEELGLKVKSLNYFGSAPNEYVFSAFTVFTIDLAFEVEAESLEDLHPKDDISDFKFYAENEFSYDDIPARSMKQFVKQFFSK